MTLPTILETTNHLCLICGRVHSVRCDFCEKFPGAVNRAYQLVQVHGSIEFILENLDARYTVPEQLDYEVARTQFGICE